MTEGKKIRCLFFLFRIVCDRIAAHRGHAGVPYQCTAEGDNTSCGGASIGMNTKGSGVSLLGMSGVESVPLVPRSYVKSVKAVYMYNRG